MNRAQHIEETAILNRRFERKYFYRVQSAIRSEIEDIQAVIWKDGVQAGISEASKLVTIKRLPKHIEALYSEVGLRYARRTWRDLQEQKRAVRGKKGVRVGDRNTKDLGTPPLVKGFGFNATWVQFLKDFLYRFLLEKITFAVAETTRETILRVLQTSIEEGWGVEKTVKELNDLPLSRTQAARIVRTEVTRAANTGAMAAGETFEFEQSKEWIAARDLRTRGRDPEDHASHVDLDGTVIDYEDEFIDKRNGDRLRYPGDPKATAASTINCRCSVAVIAKVDENGRLVPKKAKVSV